MGHQTDHVGIKKDIISNAVLINLIKQIKWTPFLSKHNLPNSTNFTREKVDILNRPIFIKHVESLINNFPRQLQAQMSSLVNSIKHLNRKLCHFSTVSARRSNTS